jgi:SnoaL-like domain
MSSAPKIVADYQQALGAGDFAAARHLLHDDLSFQGPIDTFESPEPYLESLQKLHHIIERIDVKKTFADGDDVCILYDMVTNTPAGTAFIAEWYHVKDAKIAAIRVVFDARPFAAMFAKS